MSLKIQPAVPNSPVRKRDAAVTLAPEPGGSSARASFPGRLLRFLSRRVRQLISRHRDYRRNTGFKGAPPSFSLGGLDLDFAALTSPYAEEFKAISLSVMNHSHEILGSGWAGWGYQASAPGLHGLTHPTPEASADFGQRLALALSQSRLQEFTEEFYSPLLRPAHARRAAEIHTELVRGEIIRGDLNSSDFPDHYVPIDWQRDLRTGFRWKESEWSSRQPQAHLAGVDIKVPWELARMHHLVRLGLAATCARNAGQGLMILEFRSQVLDFLAMNPPRMGVNWKCTMDVSIRMANLLAAHEIFRTLDRETKYLDRSFQEIFSRAMVDHAAHVMDNLERSDTLNSNHYLSNLAGMSIALAALAEDSEALERRSFPLGRETALFVARELSREIRDQFHPEGGNFENSTSYHRLSGEMAVFAVAALLGRAQELGLRGAVLVDLRDAAFRLASAALFTERLAMYNGRMPLIGDDDSGRFLPLTPLGRVVTRSQARNDYLSLRAQPLEQEDFPYWDEDFTCHLALTSAISGLFKPGDQGIPEARCQIERSVTAALLGDENLLDWPAPANCGKPLSLMPRDLPNCQGKVLELGRTLTSPWRGWIFPQWGLLKLRNESFTLYLNCSAFGQRGNGGHSHEDKLSLILFSGDRAIVADPGTYLYTPLPGVRELYRSSGAHGGRLAPTSSQVLWKPGTQGLFSARHCGGAGEFIISDNQIRMDLDFQGIRYSRTLVLGSRTLILQDSPSLEAASADNCPDWLVQSLTGTEKEGPMDLPPSNGYGRIPAGNQEN